MWQHRKPRSPSHQSSSLRRTRCERKRAITVRTLPCAYTNIWRPQTVAMRESRMTRNGHVRFGERGRETRLPQGRKVRSAPTLFSPVLANMTLDGLERRLRERFPKTTVKGIAAKVNFVRYADDFIVTAASKELLEQEVKPLVEAFMQERGLELSSEKTCITRVEDGFDFLGQNVRKYKTGKQYKLLIKPAQKNVHAHLE